MNAKNNLERTIDIQSPLSLSTARKRFSSVGMACLVILAVSYGIQYAVATITDTFAPQLYDSPWFIWVLTFAPVYLVAVPIGLAMLKRIPKDCPEQHKMSTGQLSVFLIMCISIMYIGNLIGIIVMTIIQTNTGITVPNALTAYVLGDGMAFKIICLVILAPIIEELVFRKQIIDRLKRYGEGMSIFVSALLFGLFHGNLYQFFYAFGLGLLFAYVYIRTGRLRYSVILHMIINLIGTVIGPWLVQGLDLEVLQNTNTMNPQILGGLLTPQFFMYMAYILTILALTIAGFVLLIVKRKSFFLKRAEEQLPKASRFHTAFFNPGMLLMIAACAVVVVLAFVSF